MTRQQHYFGSPFAVSIAFSRAVRMGDGIFVSGTDPVEPGAVLLRPEWLPQWRVEIAAGAIVGG